MKLKQEEGNPVTLTMMHCLKGNKAQRRGMEQWKAEKPVFVEVVIKGQAVNMHCKKFGGFITPDLVC